MALIAGIPGLKSETWGTLSIVSDAQVKPQVLTRYAPVEMTNLWGNEIPRFQDKVRGTADPADSLRMTKGENGVSLRDRSMAGGRGCCGWRD